MSDTLGDKAPLVEHLTELRKRLMVSVVFLLLSFFVMFPFAGYIFNFLLEPLNAIWGQQEGRRVIYTALHEKFFVDIKIAFFAGFFVSFPIIAGQIWMFMAPGLYKHEKAAFLPFLVATPILFLMGSAFVYYIVLPAAWEFFAGFEQLSQAGTLDIQLEPKANEYLSLVMRLIFAFGFSFELPVVLTLLARIGLATPDGLRKKRRYAILLAFVAAAVLTPPDPLSQIGLAIPIIILYEISILSAVLVYKQKAQREKELGLDDDDEDEDLEENTSEETGPEWEQPEEILDREARIKAHDEAEGP
ncbi:twin-arginine translocase subunit TatC [Curvivirga aplysinae]|uniref:twin-arginine translocase subunit TatC n=1 Tax=Curvivirga aplysinae TaxID=2529852 RepID=UPI0012BD4C6A|nr:twin-arginine translocase subunit TatC [Curvivirga aplysinae]MTI10705.1 twin-arginine translocase subunit TatC [Curvivirga aplysinae]